MTNRRHGGVLILAAPKGLVREARGLVSRAIREVLRVRKWYTAPHHVDYMSDAEARAEGCGGDPRYLLDTTDAEWALLTTAIHRLALAAGWTGSPVDAYYDHPFREELYEMSEEDLRALVSKENTL